MDLFSLTAVSPIDGRYSAKTINLRELVSEYGLIKARVRVEAEWLSFLAIQAQLPELSDFGQTQVERLQPLIHDFSAEQAAQIKTIGQTTNHDVKAIEYYIQGKVKKALHPWIHFALTSEDVNNLSYSLMWQDGLKQVYLPSLQSVNKELKKLAQKYKGSSLLALTHGQPATPTTFGKELAVFCARLDRQISQIKPHTLLGKFSGATGTWSAHMVAYPKVDWTRFASKFIKSIGLEPNLITTQIEPHDSLAESFHQVIRVNSVLTDLCRDMWSYISRGILGQKKVAGEVGSSTMPHKINPIQFENAEGNMGIANAILNHLSMKLPISRMQRDLTDSTTLRNQGVALGHSYLALQNILKGLGRITINKTQMANELNNHWEVQGEAIQTILRKNGKQDAYEQLKSLTQGQSITADSMSKFVSELNISDEDKRTLLKLTPENYTGLSSKLVDLL